MPDPQALDSQRERQLVERIQGGDRAALGPLLEAHQRRVYHVCLRMVGNPDDAAELTQEALLRAIDHIDGFEKSSRFGTWLMRIAMNLCISHHRKARLRVAASLDAARDGRGDGGPPPALKEVMASHREHSPELGVEYREQVARLHAAMDSLDPTLRGILLLRDLQGMDYQQVARALDIPVGTVKSRLFRARLALREALEDRTPRAAGSLDRQNNG